MVNLFAKFEVCTFSRSTDIRGPKIFAFLVQEFKGELNLHNRWQTDD